MIIKTPAGTLPYRQFTFPDGQRHLALLSLDAGGFQEATIEAPIRNANDLFDILLAKNVLDHHNFATSLHIRYLLGARMDRRMNWSEPFTLDIVARILNGAGFRQIRILDPHSSQACVLVNAQPVLPVGILTRVLAEYMPADAVVIAPDKGATARVRDMVKGSPWFTVVQCLKDRDPATGRIGGVVVQDPSRVAGKTCIIVDDICDGGATFVALARVLRDHGATAVHLYVTHGIFSKGLPLDGIDKVYTTNSYWTGPHPFTDAPLVMFDVTV